MFDDSRLDDCKQLDILFTGIEALWCHYKQHGLDADLWLRTGREIYHHLRDGTWRDISAQRKRELISEFEYSHLMREEEFQGAESMGSIPEGTTSQVWAAIKYLLGK